MFVSCLLYRLLSPMRGVNQWILAFWGAQTVRLVFSKLHKKNSFFYPNVWSKIISGIRIQQLHSYLQHIVFSNYLKYTFSTNLIRPLSNLAHDFSGFFGRPLLWPSSKAGGRPFLLVSCSFHLQRLGERINTHRRTIIHGGPNSEKSAI